MPTYQEIVDNVRSFLACAKSGHDGQFAETAEQYARLCREANERLRRCMEALQRGLRSDAIATAEAEPNLLDLVAALDFPELPQYRQACGDEMVVAPALLIEAATALNEAYAAEQPVQTLLARHRLMAVARAPFAERLVVMRRLAELEPASAFWDDDIRKLEAARLGEIRSHMRKAVEAGDAAQVARLRDEAAASHWRTAVPESLRQSLRDSATQLAATRALSELRQLLPKLNDAYSALAYDECTELMGQWDYIAAEPGLTIPADLQEQIDAVAGWLGEENQRRAQQAAHDEACSALQQAIDTDQPTPALERAYQAVVRLHLELPPELEARYHQRLTARAVATRHRRRLMYTGIAAATLLIAAAITLVSFQALRATEIADAQKALGQALAEVRQGDIAKGEAVRKQVAAEHPRILQSPLIIAVLADLDSAEKAERQRQADFQQHMAAADAAGVEHPDADALRQAVALAKTSAESALLQDLQDRLAEYAKRVQQESDQQFSRDGAALSAEIAQRLAPGQLSAQPDQYARDMQSLLKQVDGLRQRTGVSNRLKDAQLVSLDAVLGRRQQDLMRTQSQRSAFDRLRSFGTTAQDHANTLKQYIETCPDDPRCTDFARAAAQLPAAQAVQDWSALVGGWAGQLAPTNCASAKDRAGEVQKYLQQYPDSPVGDAAKAYLGYLNKGVEVASADGAWKTSLSSLLKSPLVRNLYYLDETDGLRWYVTSDAKVQSTSIEGAIRTQAFEAVTSPDITRPAKIILREAHLLKSADITPSPQRAFAEDTDGKLAALDFGNWEVFGLDTIKDLMGRRGLDPVLRAILVQHLVQLNQPAADWAGQTDLNKVADLLVAQNVEDIAWLDPRNPPAKDVVDKLNSIVGKLPALLPAARTAMLQHRDAVLRDAQLSVDGLAILLRTGDTYEIAGPVGAHAGTTAWVLNSEKHLVQIAQHDEHAWVVDEANARLAPQGALVFIVGPNK